MDLETLHQELQEIKVQVALAKKDISQFNTVIEKLDKTNDKIQDLIDNIHTIVNLHDTKLTLSERDIINLQSEIGVMKGKITKLERAEWAFIGITTFMIFVLNAHSIVEFFSK